MRPRLLATLTIAAAALLLAAPAQADFQTLYDDYHADGVIDGCSYSASELGAGLTDIPADVREYDPGFSDAINAALEQIAAGCGTAPAVAATKNEVVAADGSPGPTVPRQLVVHAAEAGPALPGVLTALIVVMGAGLATAAVLVVRRRRSASNL